MRKLKILICELLLVVSFVGLCGTYALIVWGKIAEPVKVYQGRWVEDIVKVGDWWSVGVLEVLGK